MSATEEPLNSLDGWVAFRPNVFADDEACTSFANGKARHEFLVAWNHAQAKLAITYIEGHRKVSDKQSKSHACCLRYNKHTNI